MEAEWKEEMYLVRFLENYGRLIDSTSSTDIKEVLALADEMTNLEMSSANASFEKYNA